jgi:hypothetical protein
MRSFGFIFAIVSLSSALHAGETCPGEVKLLLSPQTVQTVITSLQFEKEIAGRVYFFDTDEFDLLKQGVIVRVRQGANNDLTVKVRVPEGNRQVNATQLHGSFPCETNQTGVGKDTDYSVRRNYKVLQMPEMGSDISNSLSPPQKRLLQEAEVSIDWGRVKRIADVKIRKWETTSQLPFRKLTLELWEWPEGNILELSTKVAGDAWTSKYAELRRLVDMKGLSLSASQGAKTSMVLQDTSAHHTPPPR